MRLLMLLSGLAAKAWKRLRNAKGCRARAFSDAETWYESAWPGERCGSDTRCEACQPDGVCDACDTIDGRWVDAVAEYAQTCDGCGDLTMNENLTEDGSTRLSYCQKCRVSGGRGYRHGWYSVENDRQLGHYFCKAADGGVVKVTNATHSPAGGLAGWPDAVYVGELASCAPCQPPLPMTEERAKFVVAFLKRAFSVRTITSRSPLDVKRGGRIKDIHAFPTPGSPDWSVQFDVSGRTWFIHRSQIGIDLGKAGPELWDLGESTPKLWVEMTADSSTARSTFEPDGGCLSHEDRSFWSMAKRALWTGNYDGTARARDYLRL